MKKHTILLAIRFKIPLIGAINKLGKQHVIFYGNNKYKKEEN